MKNTTVKSQKNNVVVIPKKIIKKVCSQIPDGMSVYQITTSDVKLQDQLDAYFLDENTFEVPTRYVKKTKSGYCVELVNSEKFMTDNYAPITFGYWKKNRPTIFVIMEGFTYELKPTVTIPPEIARFKIKVIGKKKDSDAVKVKILSGEHSHQFLDWTQPPCIFKISEYKQKPGIGLIIQTDEKLNIMDLNTDSIMEIGHISLTVIKCITYEDGQYIVVEVVEPEDLDSTAPNLDINKLSFDDLSDMYHGFDTWAPPKKPRPPLRIVR